MVVMLGCKSKPPEHPYPLASAPADKNAEDGTALAKAQELLWEADRLSRAGQHDRAGVVALEALEVRALAYGNYSPELTPTLLWVADVLIRGGRYAKAYELAARAEKIGESREATWTVRAARWRLGYIVRKREAGAAR